MTIKTETLDLTIGRRVAAARMASGCLASDTAARLDLSVESYSAREKGRERFRSRDLAILARLFGVDVRRFFADESQRLEIAPAASKFALADWIKASRDREGLNALMQADQAASSSPLKAKAA